MGNSKYKEEHINFIINTYKETNDVSITATKFRDTYFYVTDNAIRIILCKHKCLPESIIVHQKVMQAKKFNPIIDRISKLYGKLYNSIEFALRRNRIKPEKFIELLEDPDLIHKRDEFYSLFRSENTADHYWTDIWELDIRDIKIKNKGRIYEQ